MWKKMYEFLRDRGSIWFVILMFCPKIRSLLVYDIIRDNSLTNCSLKVTGGMKKSNYLCREKKLYFFKYYSITIKACLILFPGLRIQIELERITPPTRNREQIRITVHMAVVFF